jgi:hypothetical protein
LEQAQAAGEDAEAAKKRDRERRRKQRAARREAREEKKRQAKEAADVAERESRTRAAIDITLRLARTGRLRGMGVHGAWQMSEAEQKQWEEWLHKKVEELRLFYKERDQRNQRLMAEYRAREEWMRKLRNERYRDFERKRVGGGGTTMPESGRLHGAGAIIGNALLASVQGMSRGSNGGNTASGGASDAGSEGESEHDFMVRARQRRVESQRLQLMATGKWETLGSDHRLDPGAAIAAALLAQRQLAPHLQMAARLERLYRSRAAFDARSKTQPLSRRLMSTGPSSAPIRIGPRLQEMYQNARAAMFQKPAAEDPSMVLRGFGYNALKAMAAAEAQRKRAEAEAKERDRAERHARGEFTPPDTAHVLALQQAAASAHGQSGVIVGDSSSRRAALALRPVFAPRRVERRFRIQRADGRVLADFHRSNTAPTFPILPYTDDDILAMSSRLRASGPSPSVVAETFAVLGSEVPDTARVMTTSLGGDPAIATFRTARSINRHNPPGILYKEETGPRPPNAFHAGPGSLTGSVSVLPSRGTSPPRTSRRLSPPRGSANKTDPLLPPAADIQKMAASLLDEKTHPDDEKDADNSLTAPLPSSTPPLLRSASDTENEEKDDGQAPVISRSSSSGSILHRGPGWLMLDNAAKVRAMLAATSSPVLPPAVRSVSLTKLRSSPPPGGAPSATTATTTTTDNTKAGKKKSSSSAGRKRSSTTTTGVTSPGADIQSVPVWPIPRRYHLPASQQAGRLNMSMSPSPSSSSFTGISTSRALSSMAGSLDSPHYNGNISSITNNNNGSGTGRHGHGVLMVTSGSVSQLPTRTLQASATAPAGLLPSARTNTSDTSSHHGAAPRKHRGPRALPNVASPEGQHNRFSASLTTELSPLRPAFVKQLRTNAFSSFMLGAAPSAPGNQ